MKRQKTLLSLVSAIVLISSYLYSGLAASAETHYKPFILAQTLNSTDLNSAVSDVKAKLQKAGFEVAGEYSPYSTTHIVVVTNDRLRQHATQSENGGYGAIQRISLTQVGNTIQIAFTNPTYMAHAYRMKTDLADISQQLKDALGYEKDYGSDEGLTKDDLRDYQYKIMMPDFTDKVELAEYGSQAEALKAVNKALQKNDGNVSKVYQVDLPGKEQSVIGVHMQENQFTDCSSDKFIMSKIDFKKIKSSAHLPYEMLVKNGNVYALFAEFRIAISFPDLSMMGDNSFFSIMCAPGSIQKALTFAAGGTPED